MTEDKRVADLPRGHLPPDVEEIEVTPGRLDQNISTPEAPRLNTSPSAALVVGRDAHGAEFLHAPKPNGKIALQEDEPITDLPDLSDLPPDVQGFIKRLAQKGIKVTPGRPDPNRVLPEPLRLNTSLSAAVIEERDEYGY